MFDDKGIEREEKIYLLNIYTNIFIETKEEILKISSPHSCNWSPNHNIYNYVASLLTPRLWPPLHSHGGQRTLERLLLDSILPALRTL